MKRNTRRLSLSRTTITSLDRKRLANAQGGVVETGCVSGCPGGCTSIGGGDTCWFCPQPIQDDIYN